MANSNNPGRISHRSLKLNPEIRCAMPSMEMFWAIESRFSPFFVTRSDTQA